MSEGSCFRFSNNWIKAVAVFPSFSLRCTVEKTDHPAFKLTYYKGRSHSKLMTGWNKTLLHQATAAPSTDGCSAYRHWNSVIMPGCEGSSARTSLAPWGEQGLQDVLWHRLQRGCVTGATFNHTGRTKHQYRSRFLFLGSSKHNWLLYFNTEQQKRKYKPRWCS